MSNVKLKEAGGKILTPSFVFLLALVTAGVLVAIYRMFFGLGSVSAMNDGYPWGIWKPLNVVTFTGVASGAYAVGALAYVFNRGEYHSIVRSSVLAGAMGYTLAAISVVVDLGRYWNLWVVFFIPAYNLNSVLLEVAICVVLYTVVLWIEVSPALLDLWTRSRDSRLRQFAARHLEKVKKALPWIISMAVLLPTMHQSSLGGLYMITMSKLHPLWHSPWLSGLFLISCLTMGFGSVVVLQNLTEIFFERKMDQQLLTRMAKVPAYFCLGYVVIRLVDLYSRGQLGAVLAFDMYSWFFIAEMMMFLLPLPILFVKRLAANRGGLFLASVVLIFSGTLYRFDTYLVAFKPASGWKYFPSVGEIIFSLSLIAAGIAIFVALVKLFPILSGVFEDPSKEERTFA